MKVEPGTANHRHHRSGRHHSHHSHDHHHRRNNGATPPYYEQRGESSSGSVASQQNDNTPHRPSSVASVGAWIKAKSADWFNPTDPFGAMSLYLQTMKHFRDRRSHRHGGGHHRRRSHHHHHHHEPGGETVGERRHHSHRHHRRREEYNPDSMMTSARRQYEDGPNNNLDSGSQLTYPAQRGAGRRGGGESSSCYVDGLQDVEMEDRAQSVSSSSDIPPPERHSKKRKHRERNEIQRRDRVVVVCYIAVNCLLAAIGLGAAVLAGLAAFQPQTYKPFYKTEVARIFADMYKMQTECGKNFDKFLISPAVILPGAFEAICYSGIALCVVSVFALFIPLIASRTPKLQALHVTLHIFYIIAMIAFTAVTAAYLCIYFQNIDQIEADLRVKAKSSYVYKFRGNPTQTCDPISNFVNFIQRYFRCCGVDDGHDFEEEGMVPYFPGTIVDDGRTYSDVDERPIQMVPLTCCRLGRYYDPVNGTVPDDMGSKVRGGTTKSPFKGRKPRGWMIDLCRRVDSPLYGFSDRTSYMRIGCWPIVKEFFTQPARIGLISLGVFCLVLLFAATLSFLQTRLC